MANRSVVKRMTEAVDAFEAGRFSATVLETLVEAHLGALEAIGSRVVDACRDATYHVVAAETDDELSAALNGLRAVLSGIPDSAEGD